MSICVEELGEKLVVLERISVSSLPWLCPTGPRTLVCRIHHMGRAAPLQAFLVRHESVAEFQQEQAYQRTAAQAAIILTLLMPFRKVF